DHTVYLAFLHKPPCNATRSGLNGEVVALDAETGKVRWKVTMAPTESSPLVAGGLVYVGDWSGKLYALNAHSGRVVWTYQTGDRVKDGVAYGGGRVYVANFSGRTYGLDARTGKVLWIFRRGRYAGVVADTVRLYLVGYGRIFAFFPRNRR